jgi:glutathione S-transferase
MFAAEAGIELPTQIIDVLAAENHRAPYNVEVNRTGRVPALRLDCGFVLCEVLPICEYLDEAAAGSSLIGSNSRERAETRMWTRMIDLLYVERMTDAIKFRPSKIRDMHAKFNYKTMLPADDWSFCRDIALEKLSWIDQELKDREFVCGDRFTLADIHLFVFVDFFSRVNLRHPGELTWIEDHLQRVGKRPSALASEPTYWVARAI